MHSAYGMAQLEFEIGVHGGKKERCKPLVEGSILSMILKAGKKEIQIILPLYERGNFWDRGVSAFSSLLRVFFSPVFSL